MATRLIDAEYVFQHTDIDNNVDVGLIENNIDIAQDLYIQQTLGNTLLTKLINDIDNNGTPTGNYLILLAEYAQPCLALWTKYETIPSIWVRFTNKSVVEKKSDSSDPVDLPSLSYIRGVVMKQAERYSQRMREYIISNPTLFPEYYGISGVGQMTPDPFNYFAGLYIPSKGTRRGGNYGGINVYK